MNTQTARDQYPELLSGFDADGKPRCNYRQAVNVPFIASGHWDRGIVQLGFHPVVVEAARALAAVFEKFGYPFLETAGGSLSCRNIAGVSTVRLARQAAEQKAYATSLHTHGLAIDINPSQNRYRHQIGPIQWGRQTDMDPAMIAAVEQIRTNGGFRVWEWGGRWTNIKDPMHFQATGCTRSQLERGIDWTTVPETEGLKMYLTIKQLQEALNAAGATPPLKVDGIYGPITQGKFVEALMKSGSTPATFSYTISGPDLKIGGTDV